MTQFFSNRFYSPNFQSLNSFKKYGPSNRWKLSIFPSHFSWNIFIRPSFYVDVTMQIYIIIPTYIFFKIIFFSQFSVPPCSSTLQRKKIREQNCFADRYYHVPDPGYFTLHFSAIRHFRLLRRMDIRAKHLFCICYPHHHRIRRPCSRFVSFILV